MEWKYLINELCYEKKKELNYLNGVCKNIIMYINGKVNWDISLFIDFKMWWDIK